MSVFVHPDAFFVLLDAFFVLLDAFLRDLIRWNSSSRGGAHGGAQRSRELVRANRAARTRAASRTHVFESCGDGLGGAGRVLLGQLRDGST